MNLRFKTIAAFLSGRVGNAYITRSCIVERYQIVAAYCLSIIEGVTLEFIERLECLDAKCASALPQRIDVCSQQTLLLKFIQPRTLRTVVSFGGSAACFAARCSSSVRTV